MTKRIASQNENYSAQYERYLREIVAQGPLPRGTPEWEERERARAALGCECLSHGPVPEDGEQVL